MASSKKKKTSASRTPSPEPAKPAQKTTPPAPAPKTVTPKSTPPPAPTPAKAVAPAPKATPVTPPPSAAPAAAKKGSNTPPPAPAPAPKTQAPAAPPTAKTPVAPPKPTPPTAAAAPKAPAAPAAPAKATAPATPAPKAPPTPAAPARPSPAARPTPTVPPPSILLEGDASPAPAAGGPGGRYILAPVASAPGALPEPGQLPQSYGTGRLLLVARDPHWVYAHWDLSETQLRESNRKSASGTLILRIRTGTPTSEIVVEQPVHPESRNWFVHVPQAGARYLAELGYYDKARSWVRVSISAATLTPRDELSQETWVRFETLPFDVPMAQLVALVKQAIADNTPLLEAIHQLRQEGFTDLPLFAATPSAGQAPVPPAWTSAQERALEQVLSMDEVRRVWIGSLEITELLRRQLQRGISSAGLPIAGAGESAAGPGISSLSSPFGGGAQAARGFWFNVNAELIVYGATDPNASVTIGDRPIRLRPDGTFSYRFALPDGDYALPITATSPDAVEQRQANLAFRRASEYRGEVPPHPQDPGLRTPSPHHVA